MFNLPLSLLSLLENYIFDQIYNHKFQKPSHSIVRENLICGNKIKEA